MRPWAPSETGQDGGIERDYSSYSSGRYDWSRAEKWEAKILADKASNFNSLGRGVEITENGINLTGEIASQFFISLVKGIYTSEGDGTDMINCSMLQKKVFGLIFISS